MSKCLGLRHRIALVALWAIVLIPGVALAGPPFRTDDPGVVDYQHWEFYTFTTGTHVTDDTSGALPYQCTWSTVFLNGAARCSTGGR